MGKHRITAGKTFPEILRTGIWVGIFCLAVFLFTIFLYFFVTSHYAIGADFSIYWNGGKALFLEHISPYSPQVSERIQTALYGRPALPGEDQVRYAYPPFSLIVILPSVFTTFAWADAYWMAFNFVALFAAVKFAFPRLPRWVFLSMVFFLPVARSLILGQYALLLGTCLITVYGLIDRERPSSAPRQWAAGALLAWCLMKPQLTLLFTLFFLVDAVRRRLWGVFYGLASAALFFGLLSFWWLPDWMIQWHALVTDYVGYVPIQPLYQLYASSLIPAPWDKWLGIIFLLIAVLATLWMAKAWWCDPKFDQLLLVSMAILGQIISPNPKSMISDQIIFLLPMLIWLAGKTTGPHWEKPLWWSIFVLSIWVVFSLFFAGQEPLQAEATLPLVGLVWLIWISLRTQTAQREVMA